jgi:hypothetical protein
MTFLSDDLDFPACRLFNESVAAAIAKRRRAVRTDDDPVFAANAHNGCHVEDLQSTLELLTQCLPDGIKENGEKG